jgi:hypothetical protein
MITLPDAPIFFRSVLYLPNRLSLMPVNREQTDNQVIKTEVMITTDQIKGLADRRDALRRYL